MRRKHICKHIFLQACAVAIFITLPVLGWFPCAAIEASAATPALQTSSMLSPAALAPSESAKVRVIIEIQAPDIAPAAKRPPLAVSLVIDRSGSMAAARKLEYAKVAAKTLIDNLNPDDMLSVVVYDNTVNVLVPLAPVADKEKLSGAVDDITAGGETFLSGGLTKGIEQLRPMRREGPCRVILLSDGLANEGVIDPELVAAIGAKAAVAGISVSALGLGLDFSETLLQLLAQRSSGRYYYIKDSEFLPSVVREELASIAGAFTDRLRVTVTHAAGVSGVKVFGYETTETGNGLEIGMSDLAVGEKRQVALEFAVAPDLAAGRQELGKLNLAYKNRETGTAQTVSLPIAIDVSADASERGQIEKSQATTIAQVNEEFLLLEAEAAHVMALEDLEHGRVEKARKILKAQQSALAAAPKSKATLNKLAKLRRDEAQLEAATQNQVMLKSMVKSGKSSFYMSAKGSKQGIMLQRGDKGHLVERLQTALKNVGFYQGDIDGVYGQDLVEAVKEYQKTKGIDVDGIAGADTLQAIGIN
jgi:Ca-activated chloride channel family protein